MLQARWMDVEFWAAIIAAGAAIIASVLTSYLTYWFAQQQNKRQYELKWLEERFGPALDFLGRVYALVSNVPNTPEGREQLVNEIHNLVVGPSQESNAWCIAVLLDPEDTGLRDLILSVLAYARIAESEREFIDYQVKLHWSLQALAEEFRREREAIASGKSLETLIRARKTALDKQIQELKRVQDTLSSFVEGKVELGSALRKIEHSRVRGFNLDLLLRGVANGLDCERQARVNCIRDECKRRGWLIKSQSD
jgi:hypothetical protein